MADKKLNRVDVAVHLGETIDGLQRLREEVLSGEFDDYGSIALGHGFAHAMNHLCAAWHHKWMSNEEIDKVDDGTFLTIGTSIPNWNLEFRLVDPNIDITGG